MYWREQPTAKGFSQWLCRRVANSVRGGGFGVCVKGGRGEQQQQNCKGWSTLVAAGLKYGLSKVF